MKYIKVKLTDDQAHRIIEALEADINPNYPLSDKFNAFNLRLIKKLKAELVK